MSIRLRSTRFLPLQSGQKSMLRVSVSSSSTTARVVPLTPAAGTLFLHETRCSLALFRSATQTRCAPLGSPSHSVPHYGGEGQQGRMGRAQPRELGDLDPPCELHQPRRPRPKAQAHQDDLLFVVLGHLVQHGKQRHDLVQGLVQQGSVQGSAAESRLCAGSSIARGTRRTNAAGNRQQQQQQQRNWHKTQRWMLFSPAPLLFL